MAWLFGQVWLLCLVAFLLGAAVTWVAFVVPARRASRRRPLVDHEWNPTPPMGMRPQQPTRHARGAGLSQQPPPDVPLAGLNSALAALDAWNGPAGVRPGTAEEATSALEKLGVGAPPPEPVEEPADPPPVPAPQQSPEN
ncbi:MAG: hypothetical protein J0I34_09065 [Pseudonocardia sp.]|uniref:hypothetical protein n=1 Tax=Pseudonocardia sp. TaxID=60912 RepID=UPI00086ADB52|nr:hypothetical protein [Pseudonocardia sp.]MBN9108919.1 hypothetical protein [Pseudonocardia sp.]ODU04238.1 MAG: hypothetical protein ABS80_26035 [Pseudonocardia sp. SCN 72-51]